MTIDELKAMLASMPPEEREVLLQSLYADYGGQEQNLNERSDYASELRGTPEQGMRNAGRLKVAANPLEFLATGGSRALGDYERRQVNQDRTAMGGRKENALAALVRGMMGSGGGPPAGAGRPMPPGAPPPGMPGGTPGAGPGMGAVNPQAALAMALRSGR